MNAQKIMSTASFKTLNASLIGMHLNDHPLSSAERIDSDNEGKQWQANEGEVSSFRPEHNPKKTPCLLQTPIASACSQTRALQRHSSTETLENSIRSRTHSNPSDY